jgi:hypothetical protein
MFLKAAGLLQLVPLPFPKGRGISFQAVDLSQEGSHFFGGKEKRKGLNNQQHIFPFPLQRLRSEPFISWVVETKLPQRQKLSQPRVYIRKWKGEQIGKEKMISKKIRYSYFYGGPLFAIHFPTGFFSSLPVGP